MNSSIAPNQAACANLRTMTVLYISSPLPSAKASAQVRAGACIQKAVTVYQGTKPTWCVKQARNQMIRFGIRSHKKQVVCLASGNDGIVEQLSGEELEKQEFGSLCTPSTSTSSMATASTVSPLDYGFDSEEILEREIAKNATTYLATQVEDSSDSEDEYLDPETKRRKARQTVLVQLLMVIAGAATLWTLRPPLEGEDVNQAIAVHDSDRGALIRVGIWVSYFVLKYALQLYEEFMQTLA